MLQDKDLIHTDIDNRLLDWFRANHRKLPWREDRDAYHIWVSEIMLQQTRVEAVVNYYLRFMKELPDVKSLAACEEERLLKLWEGLGYYNRVKNMKAAAVSIMEDYAGKMPQNSGELLKLKGIGSYTSRAIASQAFEEPVSCVDGNVLRVITRICGDDTDIARGSFKTAVEKKLDELIQSSKKAMEFPGEFNQALMELGAVICVPNGLPKCEECPVNHLCDAYKNHCQMDYPVKSKAKARRIEEITVFILRYENRFLIQKRPNKGLLAGLYEFPNTEGHLNEKDALKYLKKHGLSGIRLKKLDGAKHIFSHVEWHMIGYEIRLDEWALEDFKGEHSHYTIVEIEDMEKTYSIPAAFEAYKAYLQVKSLTSKKK